MDTANQLEAKTKLPERAVQNLMEIIAQLSNVKRYSRDFMVKPENVLEHTGFVVVFCLLLAYRLRAQGHPVNLETLMVKATLHDVEEGITGDVPRMTKYSSREVKDGINKYGETAIRQIEKLLKVEIMYDWRSAKNDTFEGLIVKVADMAAVVYKTMSEVGMYGNKSFLRVSEEINGEIGKLVEEHRGSVLYPVLVEMADILTMARRGDIAFGAFFKGL